MQPAAPASKRRPILGTIVLCAIAAAGYLILAPEPPMVLTSTELASVTTADTFTHVAGAGKRTMHVFISVDCSFCRKVEPELALLSNVTLRYHLLPGHSASRKLEATRVWCAPDQVQAWRAVAQGREVPAADCDNSALDRNLALVTKLKIERTPAMVLADGRVLTGALSKDALEAELARSDGQAAK
jgi:thiol:disulfide interchange protein DsbC